MNKKITDSKSFCLAPWMSIHTWPDGRTFPCCAWDMKTPVGNANDSTISQIWNNSAMKKTRKLMLEGKEVKGCSRCYYMERTSGSSYRLKINKDFRHTLNYVEETQDSGHLDSMNIHLWDLRLSNFCNFKCRTCGLDLSSSWYSDHKAMFGHAKKALINLKDKSKFLQEIEPHYNCVDEIYFAGGEPLLMPDHYSILKKLIELNRTDVKIRYSTNFSSLIFKNKHIFDYWKHFKNLEIYISVDGVGKIGEYVRKGFNYEKFLKNVLELKNSNLNTYTTAYAVTYSTLNYLHLFDLVIDFFEKGILTKEYNAEKYYIDFSPVTNPDYYDAAFLPDKFKKDFNFRLNNFDQELLNIGVDSRVIKNILTKLNIVNSRVNEGKFNYKNMQKLKKVTDKLDELREEKLDSVFDYFDSSLDFLDLNLERSLI